MHSKHETMNVSHLVGYVSTVKSRATKRLLDYENTKGQSLQKDDLKAVCRFVSALVFSTQYS
jgi:hypothetical protein